MLPTFAFEVSVKVICCFSHLIFDTVKPALGNGFTTTVLDFVALAQPLSVTINSLIVSKLLAVNK